MAQHFSIALLFAYFVGWSGLAFAQNNPTNTQQPAPPKELVTAIQNARSLLAQQNYLEAEKILKPATEKFADKPFPWYLLGYALHAQKRYDEALAAYAKAKTFPQVKVNTLYNIACIYSLRNKPEKAFATLDEAIKAGFNNFGQMQGDSDFANIKNDARFQKLMPKSLSDDELFLEKTRIIHQWLGEAAGDQFGWTARKAGDMDADGKIDFITTAPTHKQGAGKIYVYSSATGKLIHSVTGKPGERLGNSAVGIGDVNGDEIPDFAAGGPAPKGIGSAYVYSGKDASLIRELKGATKDDQFGYEVSELGDFDGDGCPDLFVGAMSGDGSVKKSGRGVVFSGKSGKLMFELFGEQSGDGFGNAAAASVVRPGEFLLAIGAQNAGPSNRGRVYVYQIKKAKPTLKFKIEGDQNSVNLGQMFISFPGDLNRDGVPDVYVSDFSDNTKVKGGGKVAVHSGSDGKQLLVIHGAQPGEGLGTSPSDAGDVDGDGIGDLVIGAWQNRQGPPSGGKVYLYGCAGNGKLLRTWTCKQAGDTLGFDACGIGDVDDDGNIDFLLTSAWSNKNGPKTGRVFIVAGEPLNEETQTKLENGIYLVQRWTETKKDLFPLLDDEQYIVYDENKFFELKDDEVEPVLYIGLSKTEFIPFELTKKPTTVPQQDGRLNIDLKFSKSMSEKLTTFSRKYLGRQVALVIGGEIITLHKVRSVISDDGIRISRCTDDGCQLIMSKFSDD